MLDEPFAGVDPIAVEDIQYIVWKLKDRNIGILITDHNVQETLCITDRAYLLFEGRILFKGTPPELAENRVVKEKYLGSTFVLRPKDFQLIGEKKISNEEGKKIVDDFSSNIDTKAKDLESKIRTVINEALLKVRPATKSELEELKKRVEALEKIVAGLD